MRDHCNKKDELEFKENFSFFYIQLQILMTNESILFLFVYTIVDNFLLTLYYPCIALTMEYKDKIQTQNYLGINTKEFGLFLCNIVVKQCSLSKGQSSCFYL